MPLPRVVIEGRMASEPELRFIPSGAAVCNFRVAASQMKKNEQTGAWEDDKQCFLSVAVWRDMAENVTETLHTGDPVVVTGRLSQREYEQDGQRRTAYQVDADSVGPDLRWATARVARTQRSTAGQQPQSDPWATQPAPAQQRPAQAPQQQPQQQSGWGAPTEYDPPPF